MQLQQAAISAGQLRHGVHHFHLKLCVIAMPICCAFLQPHSGWLDASRATWHADCICTLVCTMLSYFKPATVHAAYPPPPPIIPCAFKQIANSFECTAEVQYTLAEGSVRFCCLHTSSR